jgi:hypothetical protein
MNLTVRPDARTQSRRMTRQVSMLALLVGLLAALVALTPLAYATPPDPTWISGLFDDDDNDNGVFLVTSSLAAVDPFPLCGWASFSVFGPAVASNRSSGD